jgi:hypothetical protein
MGEYMIYIYPISRTYILIFNGFLLLNSLFHDGYNLIENIVPFRDSSSNITKNTGITSSLSRISLTYHHTYPLYSHYEGPKFN